MTDLPPLVQRAPTLFYAAAVLFFLASMAINMRELGSTPTSFDETMRPLVWNVVARAFYESAREAAYMIANGVMLHILLAIWRNGTAGRAGSGDLK